MRAPDLGCSDVSRGTLRQTKARAPHAAEADRDLRDHRPDGTFVTGKLGATLDLATGREAARLTGLALLATLRDHLGSFDRVVRLVKVLGIVNSTPELTDHPQVINGFSDLMIEVFDDAGLAARSAIGTSSLPANIAVEIEMVVDVR